MRMIPPSLLLPLSLPKNPKTSEWKEVGSGAVEDSVCCRLTSFWAIGCHFFINLAFKLMFFFLYILSFFFLLFLCLALSIFFVSRV